MRAQRSIANYFAQIVLTATTMILGLCASPWIERWLGPARFGAVRVAAEAQGYLLLLELGLGGALAPLLVRSISLGQASATRATLAAGARAYALIAVVTFAVGVAAAQWIPRLASGVEASVAIDLKWGWIIGLLGFLSLPLAPLRTVLEARQRGDVVQWLLTSQAVVITGVSLGLAYAGLGIRGQIFAAALGAWLFHAALAMMLFRRGSDLLGPEWRAPTSVALRRSLWALSRPTLLINVAGRMAVLTDNIIIGLILGTEAVTSLYFTQRLAVAAQSLAQGVGQATWAPLAELQALGRHELLERRMIEVSELIAVISIALLAPIAAFNQHFFSLWVLDASLPYGGFTVVAVAGMNAFLLAEFSLWNWCLTAAGHARVLAPQAVASALVNVLASVLLTRSLGVVGPLLGTTAGFLAVTGWSLPRLLEAKIGVSARRVVAASLRPWIYGLPYAAALWTASHAQERLGWTRLVLETSAGSLGFMVIAFCFVLSPSARSDWRERLLSIGRSIGLGKGGRAR